MWARSFTYVKEAVFLLGAQAIVDFRLELKIVETYCGKFFHFATLGHETVGVDRSTHCVFVLACPFAKLAT